MKKSKIFDRKEEVNFLNSLWCGEYEIPTTVNKVISAVGELTSWNQKRMIGNMCDEVRNSGCKSVREFVDYYNQKYPENYSKAVERVYKKLQEAHLDNDYYTKSLVQKFIFNVMFVKTFKGVWNESNVLKFVSELLGKECVMANSAEDSRGIDAFISGKRVQVKPSSYSGIVDETFIIYDANRGIVKFSSAYLCSDNDDKNDEKMTA